MIENLKIKNYKSLENIELELKNLNLLTGINSTGKSSIIQVILLFEQYLKENSDLLKVLKEIRDINPKTMKDLKLNGELVELGVIGDLLFEDAMDDKLSFEFIKNRICFSITIDTMEQEFEEELKCQIKCEDIVSLISERKNIQYLTAERIVPKSSYSYSTDMIKKKDIGKTGEYSIHYLAENKNEEIKIKELKYENSKTNQLLENVSLWLSKISDGISVDVRASSDVRNAILKYQYKRGKLKLPQNVGFGITYVLPIIVAILKAEKGDLVVIENPESHLHPRGQVEIAKLCAIAAQNGVQIIIETHSDHILNGIRVAVKEKDIDYRNTSVYYFSKDDLRTEAFKVEIDEKGKIGKWPKGFFDEWNIQLEKLLW
ncbi:AAA family ATPase [Fusobacterium ulcerans]|uniref:AAA domain-containing protein n=1 Tax=Fusobacterium ulcerans 12-1B TaxID=457404 RepID=H1PPC0_9FUSO|nr:DUF3696 domain-containing protein [Fusobacterium ulcerans]EHO84444.1 hypothetical protein HMPREF0402_00263 [Fusobacterium ulcerans 12-1B]